MKRRWMRKIPVIIAIAALAIFSFSGAVMLLWNNILPVVFHIGTITFWQAMGILLLSKMLLLLSKMLFGGFRGRGRYA